ncbi:unnamed protein product [Caenorhabditis angaria]|uniref:Uncharacterized protein n=1 Tax=Caenorhabditis angaria TaxID=860376 RepID=A0A9P1IFD7_9PELO|nr:unnamed protein product [Caenorhabditis angaria]
MERAARAARSLERLSGLSGLVARAPKPLRRSSGSMLERLSERAAQMALAAQRLKPSKPLVGSSGLGARASGSLGS